VKHTSRVTKDEATHGDTQAEDERAPSEVLDGAIVDDALILLSGGRISASRCRGLGGELRVLTTLKTGHDVADTHDASYQTGSGKSRRVYRREGWRKKKKDGGLGRGSEQINSMTSLAEN
jgi:hypothetical protein